ADARAPAALARHLDIFGGAPEGAIVAGVHAEHGIVAPATAGAGLRASAVNQGGLALAQLAQWVGDQAARIADRRVDAGAGGTVQHGNIAAAIHRRAAHPTVNAIAQREGALLIEGGRACVGIADLIPADARHPAGVDRVIHHERL